MEEYKGGKNKTDTDYQQIAGHGAGNTFGVKRLRQTRETQLYTPYEIAKTKTKPNKATLDCSNLMILLFRGWVTGVTSCPADIQAFELHVFTQWLIFTLHQRL